MNLLNLKDREFACSAVVSIQVMQLHLTPLRGNDESKDSITADFRCSQQDIEDLQSMPRPLQKFTPELMANGKYRYEETDESVHLIAQDFQVSRSYFDRLINRWGWRRRRDRPPRGLPESQQILRETSQAQPEAAASQAADETITGQGDRAATGSGASASLSLADRLERAVERELTAVELMREQYGSLPQPPMGAERTARTLATLTETLFKVRRLQSPDLPTAGADAFDDMPRDIDEFRNQLAQRIEKFVRSWSAEAVPAASDSSRTTSP